MDGGEDLSVSASDFSLAFMSCLPYTAHIMIEAECIALFLLLLTTLPTTCPFSTTQATNNVVGGPGTLYASASVRRTPTSSACVCISLRSDVCRAVVTTSLCVLSWIQSLTS